METRRFGLADRVVGEIDNIIKILSVPARSTRGLPECAAEAELTEAVRASSARLMRVNHSGEVAAQALYQGQALTAREPHIRAAMRESAAEEMDHLAWCEQRLRELKGRTSILNPLWYLGSFAIGAIAGALGDRTSLGFIAETEKQVESHLREHLELLSPADMRSRAIVEQMRHEEIQHGAKAASMGGKPLPFPVALAMRATSRLMTRGSFWV
jgi:3-demethoxyubiquinol 3-hydroxylase